MSGGPLSRRPVESPALRFTIIGGDTVPSRPSGLSSEMVGAFFLISCCQCGHIATLYGESRVP